MAQTQTITLPHLPAFPIHLSLFTSVTNAARIRSQLLAGNPSFEYAFLDATTLFSPIHIETAIFRAINDFQNNRLKSRNVHSEIVFSLSPTNNIADSFRKFGIQDKTTELLAVRISTPDTPVSTEDVSEFLGREVQGTSVPFDTIGDKVDWPAVRKIYKLGPFGTGNAGQKPKANGVHHTDISAEERQEAEIVVMGLIALKGS